VVTSILEEYATNKMETAHSYEALVLILSYMMSQHKLSVSLSLRSDL